MEKWPDKNARELWALRFFIEKYSLLVHGRTFEFSEHRDKPDFIIRDKYSDELYGLEVTECYISDKSIPEKHLNNEDINIFDFKKEEIPKYFERVLEKVNVKIQHARNGYDLRFPIILFIYVNEYIRIYINQARWDKFVHDNSWVFDSMTPFCEVVLGPIQDDGIISITPEESKTSRDNITITRSS